MTERARIAIAAAVTCLFLAGISVAGVAAHHSKPAAAVSATAPAPAVGPLPAARPQVAYEHAGGEQSD